MDERLCRQVLGKSRIARQVNRKAVDIASVPPIDLGKVHRVHLAHNTVMTEQGYRNFVILALRRFEM
jgi:hypothetical protein